jgi:small GTP-binding protein
MEDVWGEAARDANYHKMILIGSSGVGKSSLLSTALRSDFRAVRSTTSVEYSELQIAVDNRLLSLHVWDTAGQEQYRAICRPYYRGARVALLCFTIEEQNSISDWVTEIKDHEPSCTIILVLTKKDLLTDQEVTEFESEAENLAIANSAHGCHLTSSRTGEGVLELFQEAARTVMMHDGEWEEVLGPIEAEESQACSC